MVEKKVILSNSTGMHARPASVFIKEVKKFNAKTTLFIRGKWFDAASMISLLSMGAKYGDELLIRVEGQDEIIALEAVEALFESNFGE